MHTASLREQRFVNHQQLIKLFIMPTWDGQREWDTTVGRGGTSMGGGNMVSVVGHPSRRFHQTLPNFRIALMTWGQIHRAA